MAQWLAQDSYKVKVPGSSPGWCTLSQHGGIGRHRRLKIFRLQSCTGSSPVAGINKFIINERLKCKSIIIR
jgi:hypothetical protein